MRSKPLSSKMLDDGFDGTLAMLPGFGKISSGVLNMDNVRHRGAYPLVAIDKFEFEVDRLLGES